MCQSIPGFPGYFSKGGILYVESWDDTDCVRDSPDTFQERYTVCGILG